MVNRRREEVEQRLGTLEAEYEELLGELHFLSDDSDSHLTNAFTFSSDRTDDPRGGGEQRRYCRDDG